MELHAAGQPNHQEYDQHEAENPTQSRTAVAIIAIVASPAAEQQDQHDDDERVPTTDLHIHDEEPRSWPRFRHGGRNVAAEDRD
jgi:hypothetical protein